VTRLDAHGTLIRLDARVTRHALRRFSPAPVSELRDADDAARGERYLEAWIDLSVMAYRGEKNDR
jgi:hypothetical protein